MSLPVMSLLLPQRPRRVTLLAAGLPSSSSAKRPGSRRAASAPATLNGTITHVLAQGGHPPTALAWRFVADSGGAHLVRLAGATFRQLDEEPPPPLQPQPEEPAPEPGHDAAGCHSWRKAQDAGVASAADLVGRRIKVWWPDDKKFYFGFCTDFFVQPADTAAAAAAAADGGAGAGPPRDQSSRKRAAEGEGAAGDADSIWDKHRVVYSDGEVELLRLTTSAGEVWALTELEAAQLQQLQLEQQQWPQLPLPSAGGEQTNIAPDRVSGPDLPLADDPVPAKRKPGRPRKDQSRAPASLGLGLDLASFGLLLSTPAPAPHGEQVAGMPAAEASTELRQRPHPPVQPTAAAAAALPPRAPAASQTHTPCSASAAACGGPAPSALRDGSSSGGSHESVQAATPCAPAAPGADPAAAQQASAAPAAAALPLPDSCEVPVLCACAIADAAPQRRAAADSLGAGVPAPSAAMLLAQLEHSVSAGLLQPRLHAPDLQLSSAPWQLQLAAGPGAAAPAAAPAAGSGADQLVALLIKTPPHSQLSLMASASGAEVCYRSSSHSVARTVALPPGLVWSSRTGGAHAPQQGGSGDGPLALLQLASDGCGKLLVLGRCCSSGGAAGQPDV